MKVNIVAIGNSKGIRIPGPVLEQCGFGETAELVVKNNRLVVSPTNELRKGWDKSFKAMSQLNEDRLLDTPALLRR